MGTGGSVFPPHPTSYIAIKDALLLIFPGGDIIWVLGRELHGKLQNYSESRMEFLLRKLSFINEVKLIINLVLICMLPRFVDHFMPNIPVLSK